MDAIQCNDYNLRVNFHLEIAKYWISEDTLSRAEQHLQKALELDYSIPLRMLQEGPTKVQIDEGEDIELY